MKYVKRNALKARHFDSLEEQNDFLLHWEMTVLPIRRIHGTTKQQVGKLFEAVERAALSTASRRTLSLSSRNVEHTVHRDGHVQVDGAYYSVPT